jgi:shikimate kinase
MNLWLIGPRGSGKTTIGRLAAGRLGLRFVDADAEIERRAGRTIAELFAAAGERTFRELERTVLLELLAGDGRVVATGGGCVLDPEVREGLRRSGTAVWLDARPATRAARIAGSERPVLTALGGGPEEERVVAQAREPAYRECAALRVATDERAPREVLDDVEQFWRAAARHDVR